MTRTSMRFFRPILMLATLLAPLGCGERASNSADSSSRPRSTVSVNVPRETLDVRPAIAVCPPDDVQADSGVITYNTGDVDEWPPFDAPLDITLPPTEVPERIRGPFVLDEVPAPAQ